jgi:hypothetical protein
VCEYKKHLVFGCAACKEAWASSMMRFFESKMFANISVGVSVNKKACGIVRLRARAGPFLPEFT